VTAAGWIKQRVGGKRREQRGGKMLTPTITPSQEFLRGRRVSFLQNTTQPMSCESTRECTQSHFSDVVWRFLSFIGELSLFVFLSCFPVKIYISQNKINLLEMQNNKINLLENYARRL